MTLSDAEDDQPSKRLNISNSTISDTSMPTSSTDNIENQELGATAKVPTTSETDNEIGNFPVNDDKLISQNGLQSNLKINGHIFKDESSITNGHTSCNMEGNSSASQIEQVDNNINNEPVDFQASIDEENGHNILESGADADMNLIFSNDSQTKTVSEKLKQIESYIQQTSGAMQKLEEEGNLEKIGQYNTLVKCLRELKKTESKLTSHLNGQNLNASNSDSAGKSSGSASIGVVQGGLTREERAPESLDDRMARHETEASEISTQIRSNIARRQELMARYQATRERLSNLKRQRIGIANEQRRLLQSMGAPDSPYEDPIPGAANWTVRELESAIIDFQGLRDKLNALHNAYVAKMRATDENDADATQESRNKLNKIETKRAQVNNSLTQMAEFLRVKREAANGSGESNGASLQASGSLNKESNSATAFTHVNGHLDSSVHSSHPPTLSNDLSNRDNSTSSYSDPASLSLQYPNEISSSRQVAPEVDHNGFQRREEGILSNHHTLNTAGNSLSRRDVGADGGREPKSALEESVCDGDAETVVVGSFDDDPVIASKQRHLNSLKEQLKNMQDLLKLSTRYRDSHHTAQDVEVEAPQESAPSREDSETDNNNVASNGDFSDEPLIESEIIGLHGEVIRLSESERRNPQLANKYNQLTEAKKRLAKMEEIISLINEARQSGRPVAEVLSPENLAILNAAKAETGNEREIHSTNESHEASRQAPSTIQRDPSPVNYSELPCGRIVQPPSHNNDNLSSFLLLDKDSPLVSSINEGGAQTFKTTSKDQPRELWGGKRYDPRINELLLLQEDLKEKKNALDSLMQRMEKSSCFAADGISDRNSDTADKISSSQINQPSLINNRQGPASSARSPHALNSWLLQEHQGSDASHETNRFRNLSSNVNPTNRNQPSIESNQMNQYFNYPGSSDFSSTAVADPSLSLGLAESRSFLTRSSNLSKNDRTQIPLQDVFGDKFKSNSSNNDGLPFHQFNNLNLSSSSRGSCAVRPKLNRFSNRNIDLTTWENGENINNGASSSLPPASAKVQNSVSFALSQLNQLQETISSLYGDLQAAEESVRQADPPSASAYARNAFSPAPDSAPRKDAVPHLPFQFPSGQDPAISGQMDRSVNCPTETFGRNSNVSPAISAALQQCFSQLRLHTMEIQSLSKQIQNIERRLDTRSAHRPEDASESVPRINNSSTRDVGNFDKNIYENYAPDPLHSSSRLRPRHIVGVHSSINDRNFNCWPGVESLEEELAGIENMDNVYSVRLDKNTNDCDLPPDEYFLDWNLNEDIGFETGYLDEPTIRLASPQLDESQRRNSDILNNQVLPGTRANNYWDNFRSYSRQNPLSSAAKANDQISIIGDTAVVQNRLTHNKSHIQTQSPWSLDIKNGDFKITFSNNTVNKSTDKNIFPSRPQPKTRFRHRITSEQSHTNRPSFARASEGADSIPYQVSNNQFGHKWNNNSYEGNRNDITRRDNFSGLPPNRPLRSSFPSSPYHARKYRVNGNVFKPQQVPEHGADYPPQSLLAASTHSFGPDNVRRRNPNEEPFALPRRASSHSDEFTRQLLDSASSIISKTDRRVVLELLQEVAASNDKQRPARQNRIPSSRIKNRSYCGQSYSNDLEEDRSVNRATRRRVRSADQNDFDAHRLSSSSESLHSHSSDEVAVENWSRNAVNGSSRGRKLLNQASANLNLSPLPDPMDNVRHLPLPRSPIHRGGVPKSNEEGSLLVKDSARTFLSSPYIASPPKLPPRPDSSELDNSGAGPNNCAPLLNRSHTSPINYDHSHHSTGAKNRSAILSDNKNFAKFFYEKNSHTVDSHRANLDEAFRTVCKTVSDEVYWCVDQYDPSELSADFFLENLHHIVVTKVYAELNEMELGENFDSSFEAKLHYALSMFQNDFIPSMRHEIADVVDVVLIKYFEKFNRAKRREKNDFCPNYYSPQDSPLSIFSKTSCPNPNNEFSRLKEATQSTKSSNKEVTILGNGSRSSSGRQNVSPNQFSTPQNVTNSRDLSLNKNNSSQNYDRKHQCRTGAISKNNINQKNAQNRFERRNVVTSDCPEVSTTLHLRERNDCTTPSINKLQASETNTKGPVLESVSDINIPRRNNNEESSKMFSLSNGRAGGEAEHPSVVVAAEAAASAFPACELAEADQIPGTSKREETSKSRSALEEALFHSSSSIATNEDILVIPNDQECVEPQLDEYPTRLLNGGDLSESRSICSPEQRPPPGEDVSVDPNMNDSSGIGAFLDSGAASGSTLE